MKRCPNCGNEAETKFCTECGSPMEDIIPESAPDAVHETASDTAHDAEPEPVHEAAPNAAPETAHEPVHDIASKTAPEEEKAAQPHPENTAKKQASSSAPSEKTVYRYVSPDAETTKENKSFSEAPKDFASASSSESSFSGNQNTASNFNYANYASGTSGTSSSGSDSFTSSAGDPRDEFKNRSYEVSKSYGVSAKTWFVVLFLIFFWPVGLYLMWSRRKFTKTARIIVTVVIGALAVIGISSNFMSQKDTYDSLNSSTEQTIQSQTTEATQSTQPQTSESPSVTLGQKNALDKAHNYLSFTAFSYTGLIDQLEFEGFTKEEATYGADNCGADWNEQAAKKAQEYIDIMSFSRAGLIDQLEFEGFTKAQAEYGVKAVGY